MNTKLKAVAFVASFAFILTGLVPAYAGNRSHDSDSTKEVQHNDDGSWTWEGEPIVVRLPNGQEWNTEDVKWPWYNEDEDSENESDSRGGHWNDSDENWDDEDTSDYSDEDNSEFDINLSGDEEVPSTGDPNGEGWSNVRLHEDHNLVCVDLEVSGISLPATDAHIHKAAEGSSGPAVLALPIPNEEGDAYGCVKATDSQISEMMDNPEMFYINVHSSEYPDGAVRGQLTSSEEN